MTKKESSAKILDQLGGSDYVKNEDFTEAFTALIDVVSKIQVELNDKIKEVVDNNITYHLTDDDKRQIGKAINVPVAERITTIKEVPFVDNNLIIGETVKQVSALIPKIEDIENDLPKLGARIRDALELLQGEERLDASAIKNLKELFDEWSSSLNLSGKTVYVGGGSNSGGKVVSLYDLSSVLNGVSKTFVLPAFWKVISVSSSSFPYTFRPTIDYTVDSSAMTITFTSEIEASTTLATGQTLLVTYAE